MPSSPDPRPLARAAQRLARKGLLRRPVAAPIEGPIAAWIDRQDRVWLAELDALSRRTKDQNLKLRVLTRLMTYSALTRTRLEVTTPPPSELPDVSKLSLADLERWAALAPPEDPPDEAG